MNFELAVEKVRYRFKELGYGCMFTFKELRKWLEVDIEIENDGECHDFEYFEEQERKLGKGFNAIEVFEMLNNQLILEHSIDLEVDMDIQGFKAVFPCETRKRLALLQSKKGINGDSTG